MKTVKRPYFYRLLFPGLFYLISLPTGSAQTALDSLKNRLDQTFGKDKLEVLNQVVAVYLVEQEAKEALRYARLAETLASNIISPENQLIPAKDYYLKPQAFLQLGQAYQQLGQYPESKIAFEKALLDARQFNTPELADEAEKELLELAAIDLDSEKKKKGFLGKAIRDIGSSIDKTSNDFGIIANLKLAQMLENNQNYQKAIKKYELVINELRNQGDWEEVAELREHIAELIEKKVDVSDPNLLVFDQAREKQETPTKPDDGRHKIEIFSPQFPENRGALPRTVSPQVPRPPELATVEKELRNIRTNAMRAENNQDFEKSLNYYKQYLAMEQTLAEQEKTQELALLEKAHQLDRQDQEIALLKQNEEINRLQLAQNQIELQKQLSFKRSLGGGLVLSTMLGFSLYLLYRNKRRDHHKLGIAFHDLELTKDQLKSAEQRIKGLLTQQVSGAVANELMLGEGAQQVQRKFVCILFLDIRNFTPYVEKLSPEEIIDYQNKVLGFMIETVNKHNGIVNQILGDGFMATFGAPVSAGNDCQEAYLTAEEIIRTVKEKSDRGEIPVTRIGIGLHAGHVVAGNVGTKDRKQYSITGNPVIIAARLEQLNKEFGSTLVMSKEVYDHLPEEHKKPMVFKPVLVKGRTKPVEVAIC